MQKQQKPSNTITTKTPKPINNPNPAPKKQTIQNAKEIQNTLLTGDVLLQYTLPVISFRQRSNTEIFILIK